MPYRDDDVESDNIKLNRLEKIFKSPNILFSMIICIAPINCVYIPMIILCVWSLVTSKDKEARERTKFLLGWFIFVFVVWFFIGLNDVYRDSLR
jgi:hypothetical protein